MIKGLNEIMNTMKYQKNINDKVLMVAPSFYGYELAIVENLTKIGHEVFYISSSIGEINPVSKFIYKYISKFNPYIDCFYYNSKLSKVPDDIDVIFIIYSKYITEPIIKKILRKFPYQRYILYFWDSVYNNLSALEITKYFDKILTFDPVDSKKYGWIYRPLFYIDDYLFQDENKDIDVSLIGSVHSKRIEIANIIRSISQELGLSTYIALYSKKLMFYLKKYITKSKEFTNAPAENFIFRSLSLKETYRIYGKSKIVVDYVYPNQNGLTMRTIESLASGCFLITNNSNIKNEQFYNPDFIFIYEDVNLQIPDSFLNYGETRYRLISNEYSLSNWISEVFS